MHENFDIDLDNIKAKICNNLNDSIHKDQCMKIKKKKANKIASKQFKNASQQIHIPLKINSTKHRSFATIKNTNNLNSTEETILKANADKTEIIPASITFKKDKTKDIKMVDKITK